MASPWPVRVYLGYGAAGVVDEAGEGVTGVCVGDDVFGRGQDTQAGYAVLDAWAAKPPSAGWAVAVAGSRTRPPVLTWASMRLARTR